MKSIPVPLSYYAESSIASNNNVVSKNPGSNTYIIVGGIIIFLIVNGIWLYAYREQNRTMRAIKLDNNKLLTDLEKAKMIQYIPNHRG
jgi:hypothetical protein